MTGRAASMLVALLVGATAGAPPPADAAVAPHDVAIVIAGQGTRCVTWHTGLTGDEILNDVAAVSYRSDGVIVAINDLPADHHADDTHYWSYWHDTGSGWRYSAVGAGSYQAAAGTVEGWSFVAGAHDATPPPPVRYADICHDSAPTTAPRPTPRPTTPAASPSRHPSSAPPSFSQQAPSSRSARPTPAARARAATARPRGSSTGTSPAPSVPSVRSAVPASAVLPSLSPAAGAARHTERSAVPVLVVAIVLVGLGLAALRIRRRRT